MGYAKLHDSLLGSTIWAEDDQTRIVWITLMAMANEHGEVQTSVPGLAHFARVPVPAADRAIQKFLAPDPHSRTRDDDGRRLEVIDGGWALLNYRKYRHMASLHDAKEKHRDRQKRYRERQKKRDGGASHPASRGDAKDTEDAPERDVSRDASDVTVTQRDGGASRNDGVNVTSDACVTSQKYIAEAEAERENPLSETSPVSNPHSPSETPSSTGLFENEPPPTSPRRKRNGADHDEPKPFRCPDDWQPSEAGRTYAQDRGLDPDTVAKAFVAYWTGSRGRRERRQGWDRTFEVWCDNDAARRMGSAGSPTVRPPRGDGAFYDQLARIKSRNRQ